VAGVLCYFMTSSVKRHFGYDDSLDVFGIHGIGGTVGALLTGVFATRAVNAIFQDAPVGLIDGHAAQLIDQLMGVLVAVSIAAAGSLIILKVVDMIIGLRVPKDDEITGLDLSQHGEEGYEIGG